MLKIKRANRLYYYLLIISILLIAIFSLTGCGQAEEPAAEETPVTPVETADPAADYPSEPIILVCGSGVGGGTDSMMRGIMPYLAKYIGGEVRGENREGAHGVIAANYVFKANPDGYTLFVMNNPYEIDIMFNPDKDVTGVTSLTDFVSVGSWLNADGNAFAVLKDSEIKTMEDLTALSKTRTVNIALAGGIGSSDHITLAMTADVYDMDFQLVPYDSGGEAIAALLGKHVDAAVVSLSGDAVNPDQVALLATTLGSRVASFPDVPTFEELGHPELSLSFHVGMLAPPGTPPEIVDKLDAALQQAFDDPEFQAWAESTGKPIGEYYDQAKWADFLANYAASLEDMRPLLEEILSGAE